MLHRLLLLVVSASVLIGCGTPALSDHLTGHWTRRSVSSFIWRQEAIPLHSVTGVEFSFTDGVMILTRTGNVFGQYQVLGPDTLRIQTNDEEDRRDFVVNVAFPTTATMVWYRQANGQRRQLWEFTRTASINTFAAQLCQQYPDLGPHCSDQAALVDAWLKAHPDDFEKLK